LPGPGLAGENHILDQKNPDSAAAIVGQWESGSNCASVPKSDRLRLEWQQAGWSRRQYDFGAVSAALKQLLAEGGMKLMSPLLVTGSACVGDPDVSRSILDEAHIHPAIRETIANNRADIVREVQTAIAQNEIVIVGMGQNPFPKKARKLLDQQRLSYKYLEYGNYLSDWRRRNALKMWTGWPSFPMIFVKNVLVGGASDLQKLVESGELARMLAGKA
jgi:glutaredoxin-related protein